MTVRTKTFWMKFLWALLGIHLGAMIGLGIVYWLNVLTPVVVVPTNMHSQISVTKNYFQVYLEFNRVRDCPSTSEIWMWKDVPFNGEVLPAIVPIRSLNNSLTPVGDQQRVLLRFAIPPEVDSGEWHYVAKTVDLCSWFPWFSRNAVRQSPDMTFTIGNKS